MVGFCPAVVEAILNAGSRRVPVAANCLECDRNLRVGKSEVYVNREGRVISDRNEMFAHRFVT